jgi:hypothetical protein
LNLILLIFFCLFNFKIAWDISAIKLNKKDKDTNDDHQKKSSSNLNDDFTSNSYLPLRDIPMNDFVKQLQQEFELEGDIRNLPTDMNRLRSKYQTTSTQNSPSSDLNKTLENENQRKKPTSIEPPPQPKPALSIKPTTINSKVAAAATQTSFIEMEKPTRNQRSSTSTSTSTKQHLTKDQLIKEKREKIQKIINKQKEQHEKRVRALERLSRMERMLADNLKKMMLCNDNDESFSSLLCDSFFQQQQNETNIDDLASIDDSSDDNTNSKFNNNKYYKSDDSSSSQSPPTNRHNRFQIKNTKNNYKQPKTNIEILNLKDTTVYEQPHNVRIIKENECHLSSTSTSSLSSLESQLTDNFNIQMKKEKPRDCFVTIPTLNKEIKNYTGRLSSSIKIPNDKLLEKNSTAWFQPFSSSHATNSIISTNNQQFKPYSTQTKDKNVKFSPLPSTNRCYSEQQNERPVRDIEKPICAFKKMSLSEAFETYKHDLISRSQMRQREIKLRAERRQQELDYEKNQILLMGHHYMRGSHSNYTTNRRQNYQNNINSQMPQQQTRRREMTITQIREQTRKLYERLPEVRAKQQKQISIDNQLKNRIKSSIYKKTIQQRVLTNGPNFKLNYKALHDN